MTTSNLIYGEAIDVANYLSRVNNSIDSRSLQDALINSLRRVHRLEALTEKLELKIADLEVKIKTI